MLRQTTKKDVRYLFRACAMKIKSLNPATKMNELENGHIQKRRVRCGKPNCKCARGDFHTAFYHVWHKGGRRFQRYVRRSQVKNMRNACELNRNLQSKLRFGRAEYKQMIARIRELLKTF